MRSNWMKKYLKLNKNLGIIFERVWIIINEGWTRIMSWNYIKFSVTY